MDYRTSILGFVVGFLVGITGMGGGALMTPLLILLGWARPAVAVGTDLLWGTATKAMGSLAHCQQKTVDFKIVRRLAVGSIPGALLGLGLLAHLRKQGFDSMDRIVVRFLGVALMCVAVSLFVRWIRGWQNKEGQQLLSQDSRPAWITSVVGGIIGFLVSLTSVGSGSVIIASLLLLYPTTPLRRIVGSDVVHAFLLVGVSALGHLGLGSINFPLLGGLLIGSIPGVWLGSRSTARVPEKILAPLLASTLFFLGYKLL
jgi:uncharacterized membrane protein YfcA